MPNDFPFKKKKKPPERPPEYRLGQSYPRSWLRHPYPHKKRKNIPLLNNPPCSGNCVYIWDGTAWNLDSSTCSQNCNCGGTCNWRNGYYIYEKFICNCGSDLNNWCNNCFPCDGECTYHFNGNSWEEINSTCSICNCIDPCNSWINEPANDFSCPCGIFDQQNIANACEFCHPELLPPPPPPPPPPNNCNGPFIYGHGGACGCNCRCCPPPCCDKIKIKYKCGLRSLINGGAISPAPCLCQNLPCCGGSDTQPGSITVTMNGNSVSLTKSGNGTWEYVPVPFFCGINCNCLMTPNLTVSCSGNNNWTLIFSDSGCNSDDSSCNCSTIIGNNNITVPLTGDCNGGIINLTGSYNGCSITVTSGTSLTSPFGKFEQEFEQKPLLKIKKYSEYIKDEEKYIPLDKLNFGSGSGSGSGSGIGLGSCSSSGCTDFEVVITTTGCCIGPPGVNTMNLPLALYSIGAGTITATPSGSCCELNMNITLNTSSNNGSGPVSVSVPDAHPIIINVWPVPGSGPSATCCFPVYCGNTCDLHGGSTSIFYKKQKLGTNKVILNKKAYIEKIKNKLRKR